ncbi:MAG: hypothetical protein LBQ59_01965 [Candidatus Peribacteria bacterium]|jgi:hypothetical protein|nr:hypothetical protein [Candidatus Peribacteria bacterium]
MNEGVMARLRDLREEYIEAYRGLAALGEDIVSCVSREEQEGRMQLFRERSKMFQERFGRILSYINILTNSLPEAQIEVDMARQNLEAARRLTEELVFNEITTDFFREEDRVEEENEQNIQRGYDEVNVAVTTAYSHFHEMIGDLRDIASEIEDISNGDALEAELRSEIRRREDEREEGGGILNQTRRLSRRVRVFMENLGSRYLHIGEQNQVNQEREEERARRLERLNQIREEERARRLESRVRQQCRQRFRQRLAQRREQLIQRRALLEQHCILLRQQLRGLVQQRDEIGSRIEEQNTQYLNQRQERVEQLYEQYNQMRIQRENELAAAEARLRDRTEISDMATELQGYLDGEVGLQQALQGALATTERTSTRLFKKKKNPSTPQRT